MDDIQSIINNKIAAHRLHEHYPNDSLAERSLTVEWSEISDNKVSISQQPIYQQIKSKKRTASAEDDFNKTSKRLRPATNIPETSTTGAKSLTLKSKIESETTSPIKPSINSGLDIDEDEWAAFEAEIAATEKFESVDNVIISAPVLTSEQIKSKSIEEEYALKREKLETELSGDEEDTARKMEEELDKLLMLEEKVKRLRAKREELRSKESVVGLKNPFLSTSETTSISCKSESDTDDTDDDDDAENWDIFRLKNC